MTGLPYKLVFAVASKDSVAIYDTAHTSPIAVVGALHLAEITDLAWSPCGRRLAVSSRDGFCSVVAFDKGELGEPLGEVGAGRGMGEQLCMLRAGWGGEMTPFRPHRTTSPRPFGTSSRPGRRLPQAPRLPAPPALRRPPRPRPPEAPVASARARKRTERRGQVLPRRAARQVSQGGASSLPLWGANAWHRWR